ncbi:MAG: hypothetical protein HY226_02995 [Candidatus Vogelbacteria bacterium]|nr:hypothetical protein [Candidatus Vogelbacteria bacterium]
MSQENMDAIKPVAPKRGLIGGILHLGKLVLLGCFIMVVLAVPTFLVYCAVTGTLFVNVSKQETTIVQGLLGDTHYYVNSGPQLRLGGAVSPLIKTHTYWYSAASDQGASKDQSLPIRFYDQVTASISGSVMFTLPTKEEQLAALYTDFTNMQGIIDRLYRPVVESVLNSSGSLMSSQEAANEKRGELATYIKDQLEYGIYELGTAKAEVTTQTAVVEGKRQRVAAMIPSTVEADHKYKRQAASTFARYGIIVSSCNVFDIKFPADVEARFRAQQENTQKIEMKITEGRLATEATNTARLKGLENKMTAEAKAEVEAAKEQIEAKKDKAVAETKADQLLYVANKKFDASVANMKADQNAAVGAKALFEATHGFKDTLDNNKAINEVWANAYSKRKVPAIQMSGGGNGRDGGSDTDDLAKIMKLNALTDLKKKMVADEPDSVTPTTK